MKNIKKKHRAFWALFLLMLVLAACLCGCEQMQQNDQTGEASAVPEEEITDPNLFAQGTMMDGIDISGMTLDEARTACRADIAARYEGITVTVQLDDENSIKLTAEDLTIADTLDFTLSKVLKDRDGSENKFTYSLKLKSLEEYLAENSAEFDVAGQDAAIDHFDQETGELVFTESVDGIVIDQKATVKAAVEQFKSLQSGTVEAVVEETPAAVTTEQIKEQYTLISEFTTTSTNTENGNHNMALALSKVNGSIVNPGETFSFEEKVGNSTTAQSGFKPANGLLNGILVPMYGGGICQASTTLYGAVLRADMTIVERGCHSVPSSYVPIGQDAAVSYRQLDFQFRNDLSTPIYIAAWMDGTTLYARVYGTKSTEWDSIEVYSKQTGTLARLEKITYQVDNSLAKGEMKLVSQGNYGYTAEAWRDYIKDGEVVKSEAIHSSYYRPTGPTYKMGPGTDPNATPTPKPSEEPSASPEPTAEPTESATAAPKPTAEPTAAPTAEPTPAPTAAPTPAPTPAPTEAPAQSEPSEDTAGGE